MNNIISVNAEDFDCCVESGVSRLTLNNYIRDTGLWFPIGKFFSLSAGPSFHDFWGQNKAPFPSQKSIYFSPIFKKNSPTPKEKEKNQARLNVFCLK